MANASNAVAVDTGILLSEIPSITGFQGNTVTEKIDAAFASDIEKCRTFRVPIYYADGEPTTFPNGSTLWDERHNVWQIRQGCPAVAKTDSEYSKPAFAVRRYDNSPPIGGAGVLSDDLAPMVTLELFTGSGLATGGHTGLLVYMPEIKGVATTLTTTAVTATGTPVSVGVEDSSCMVPGQVVMIDYPSHPESVTISSVPDPTHVVATFAQTHEASVRIGNSLQGSKLGVGVSMHESAGNSCGVFPCNFNFTVVSREGHQCTGLELDATNSTGRGPGEFLADPYYPWINGQIILSVGAMEGRASTNGTQVTWSEGLSDFPTDGSMDGHTIALGGIGSFEVAPYSAGAGDSSTVLHTTVSTGGPQSNVPFRIDGKGITNALYITAATGLGAATRGIFIGAARENAILIGTDLGGGGAYAPDRGVGIYAAATFGVVVGPNQSVPGANTDVYARRAPAVFYMATARAATGTADSGNIRFEAMESDVGRMWDIYVKSNNVGLCFAYAAGNKVTISPNGQLLVGTTVPPSSGLLRVHTADDENFIVRKGTDLGASGGMTLQSVNDANDMNKPLVLVGNPIIALTGTVRVGSVDDDSSGAILQVTGAISASGGFIGTLSPSELFVGATSGINGPFLVHTGTDENFQVRHGTDLGASDGVTLHSVNDAGSTHKSLVFVGSPFIFISGNVQIGSVADDGTNRKLQVTGEVNASGGYYCQGIEVISSTQTLKNLTNTITSEVLTPDSAIQIVMGDDNVYKILAKLV